MQRPIYRRDEPMKRKRKYLLSGAIVVFLVGLGFYLYGGSQTPSGQAPLARLTTQNVDNVKNVFNAARDDVRILLFLSPT
jgi:hypothetical protein